MIDTLFIMRFILFIATVILIMIAQVYFKTTVKAEREWYAVTFIISPILTLLAFLYTWTL